MLKFLTDENVASSVVLALRKSGFNVKDIKEEKWFGAFDEKILKLAKKENRNIITHDRDFLDYPRNSHRGIILLRFLNKKPANIIKYLLPFIKSRSNELKDKIVIISENLIRIF